MPPKRKSDSGGSGPKQIDAVNAQSQADAAKHRAESFKLPQSDEDAKAAADALSNAAKPRHEKGESESALSQRIQDASAEGGFGTLMTKGFWDFFGRNLIEHGAAAWNWQTGG